MKAAVWLGSVVPATNANVNPGVDVIVSVADGVNVRNRSGETADVPIAFGNRAEDCSTGVPMGCDPNSCARMPTIGPPVPTSETDALMEDTDPRAVVEGPFPAANDTAAPDGPGVGAGTDVLGNGARLDAPPPPPPPPHAERIAIVTSPSHLRTVHPCCGID
jgi:hypothetical protein